MIKINAIRLFGFLAIALAIFDYVVREFTLGWTESSVSQQIVFYSPVAYFAFCVMLLYRQRNVNFSRFGKVYPIAAILLTICCILILAQVFFNKQFVGSASYSVVNPLFISGIPVSLVTFLLFFRKSREAMQSYFICLVVLLWLVMPVAIDALYVVQGGYRGPVEFQIAVISTTYEFVQMLAAFGIFGAVLAAPISICITVYRAFVARGFDRVYSVAIGFSILTLAIQFLNWGGFVWD